VYGPQLGADMAPALALRALPRAARGLRASGWARPHAGQGSRSCLARTAGPSPGLARCIV